MEIPKLRGHKKCSWIADFFYILKSYYLKRNLNRGHYLAERIYQATYNEGNFEQSVRICGLAVVNVLPQ